METKTHVIFLDEKHENNHNLHLVPLYKVGLIVAV